MGRAHVAAEWHNAAPLHPSAMRVVRLLILGTLLLQTAVAVCAQVPSPAPAVPAQAAATQESPLAKALAAYEKVRKAQEPQRLAAIQKLGDFVEPESTAILVAELRTGEASAGTAAASALGKKPRAEAVDPLFEVLQSTTHDQVRRACATALGAQGNRGIDLLGELLAKADPGSAAQLRAAALSGLGAAKQDRAWRLLAVASLQGRPAERLEVLRQLRGVKDMPAVDQARLRAAQDDDLLLAGTAWRQLAEVSHPRAAVVGDSLLLRAGEDPPPAVRAELVAGLGAALEPGRFEAFVQLASGGGNPVREALNGVAGRATETQGFVPWLVSKGLGSPDAGQRDLAMRILRKAPAEKVGPLLQELKPRLRKGDQKALEIAVGLQELLSKDTAWRDECVVLAQSKDEEVRTCGLTMLREMKDARGVKEAIAGLESKHWPLRSAAYQYLTVVRDVSAIEPLIRRSEKETGRLEVEANQALFVHAGRRFFSKQEWERWWSQNKQGFALPHVDSVQNASAGKGGGTASYFGIPLVSKRSAFVIDVSGSMSAKIGTDQKRTRLDEAKNQLKRAIESYPADFSCNVVVFHTTIHPVWDRMKPASKENKAELAGRVDKLAPTGGTNIHDALESAFRDPEVDTIYLLTDGAPGAGAITNVEELADEVRRWNRTRQVVIHGISIGENSRLLQRLSKESGGTYVFHR
ncbi:MAG: hypothetical protein RL148_3211 [Planctomycetota bacterium]